MRSFLEDFETDDEEEEILRPEIMEQLDEDQIEEVKERVTKFPKMFWRNLKKIIFLISFSENIEEFKQVEKNVVCEFEK